jgi:hypothetical protein
MQLIKTKKIIVMNAQPSTYEVKQFKTTPPAERELTDGEILDWTNNQVKNFKAMAQGIGFEAIQAKQKLKAIEKLNDKERIEIGRLNIETIKKEKLYLNQLPK